MKETITINNIKYIYIEDYYCLFCGHIGLYASCSQQEYNIEEELTCPHCGEIFYFGSRKDDKHRIQQFQLADK